MNYFRYQGHTLASEEALPYEPLAALPGEGEVLWCFRRPPLAGRETFAVPHPDLLTAREGVEALPTLGRGPNALPPALAAAGAAGRGRARAAAAAGVPCGMTAVLGLDRDKLRAACLAAAPEGVVEIANYNCPGQLVIGGQKAAVDAAAAKAKELGAKRCLPLKVSGPFHTSLLAPAGDALRERFKTETFGAMQFPVLFNCLGREMGEGDTIPALLERQVQSSVYMEDTIRRMAELGVERIVEIGPGKVLSGFVKKTVPSIHTCAVETCADIDALCEALKGE